MNTSLNIFIESTIMNTNTKENNTIANTELAYNFLSSLADVDAFEILRFDAQEKSIGFLKLLRQQYSTIQLGNTKKLNVGEMPYSIAIDAIKRLWDSKPRGEAKFDNFRDHQIKKLKYLIETGEFYTRKKELVGEKLAVQIDKLEKKAAAEAAKAKKAAEAEAKAAEVKAKAEAEAKAKAEAAKTAAKLEAAKAKAEALARGKSDSNKQSDPKLDFKVMNFSKDCKDTAQMLLDDLEKDCSAAELLYLAKLILDKYNK